ncbi:uncharacterized protein LOC143181033 [Calliopsis andreniformis]|uniref:uncharacterized protein LOC143181033 n=1 Tax=Calliopsis andreniformis TaxID=337506 RepID=UPI003FCDBF37
MVNENILLEVEETEDAMEFYGSCEMEACVRYHTNELNLLKYILYIIRNKCIYSRQTIVYKNKISMGYAKRIKIVIVSSLPNFLLLGNYYCYGVFQDITHFISNFLIDFMNSP